jgi:tetratricopeptide (TPR) repeat protein
VKPAKYKEMRSNFKNLALILVLLWYNAALNAQQAERYLEVRGMTEMDTRPLSNATATLYDGGTKVDSKQTGTDGTFSFRLEANKNYTVEVSKNGLITKKISFNTTLPDNESGKWVSEFGMVMVRPCEGIDYSVLQNPVDVVKFDTRRRSFESDKDYNAQMMPKLQDINIKSANCLEDKYNQLIEKAEKLFEQKNYEAARSDYQQASEIMPASTYPKKKTTEIDALLDKQKNSEAIAKQQTEQQAQQQARQQSVDNEYQAAVSQADALLKEKKYEEAKQAYAKALSIKPSESYPRAKSQEIDKAVQQKAQTEQNARKEDLNRNLDSFLDEGDSQFKAKNYDAARAAYANVLKINPSDDYAKQQIARIEKLMVNEQATRQKSVEDGYKNAVNKANAAMALQQYSLAREQYQQALSYKPDDAFTKTKIDEADRLEKEQVKNQAAADQQNKQYQDAIASAEKLFQARDLQGALSGYRLALVIKPGDTYAQQRIKGIENSLAADQAAKDKALAAEQAAKDKALAEEKAAKDKALAAEKAAKDKALAEEQAAKVIALAAEQAAKDKALAEEKAAKDKALAEEQAAKEKAINDGYNNAMALGNTALSQKQYGPAKEQYQKALSFKANDPAAKNKVAEMDLLIKQEQDRLSAEQALKKQYDDAITRAEKLLAANDYPNSKLAFGEASRLMPGESYPKQKIDEIDKILADRQKAQADQQKALADKQAKDKAYNDAIKNGDMYFSLKNYSDAKSEYNKALSVSPDELYPKNKLTEIDGLIKADQKVLAERKAKEDAYNSAISSGNDAYAQKKYPEAKGFYNQALKIKPDDTYAKDQIVLIDNLLAGIEKQKMADEAKQKQYNDFIAIADKDFDAAKYSSAKENYQKALAVIPDSPYPKQRITRIDEINKLLAQQKAATNQASKKSISSTTPLTQLNFKNDNERDIYLNELKKKYPEGVTLEIYKEKYQETRRYIIVRDDVASEFRDVLILSYKGHEYTKNGKTVTQMYFEQQVKSRTGEYFNETTFE